MQPCSRDRREQQTRPDGRLAFFRYLLRIHPVDSGSSILAIGLLHAFNAADSTHTTGDGGTIAAAGFDGQVLGLWHALIQADLPPATNIAYLIDTEVLHPGRLLDHRTAQQQDRAAVSADQRRLDDARATAPAPSHRVSPSPTTTQS